MNVPANQRQASSDDQLFLEDFATGEVFVGEAHRLDEKAFASFAALTGDRHPIHYDEAYARTTRFGRRVAHGLLLMSMTALGATALARRLGDAMVAFLEQEGRFLSPVFLDDTVTPRFEVVEVARRPGRYDGTIRFAVTLVNQHGETVLAGSHRYLLRTRGEGGKTS